MSESQEGRFEEVTPRIIVSKHRAGDIRVSADVITGIDFSMTDTQGQLMDKGVFAAVHALLLLPESYTIQAIFFDYCLWRGWHIYVESPELPILEAGAVPPELIPWYRRDEDGTTRLVEIRQEGK